MNPRIRLARVATPMVLAERTVSRVETGILTGGETLWYGVAMPILHSAAKRMRADRARHQRNLRLATELKTLIKQFEVAVQAKEAPKAQTALRLVTKKMDLAASKGLLHRNTASRKKSRLSRRLAQLTAAA